MTDDELVIEREMRLEAEAQRESADQWAATMRMERDAMERERDASRALVKEKDAALEGYIAADTALGPDLTDEDVSRIRDINLARGSAALALTEADIAGLEAKS